MNGSELEHESERPPGPLGEYVRGRACAALRPYVAWYSGYRQDGLPPGRHRGLPSPYLTLIFTLDDPLTVVSHPDPHQGPGDYVTLLGGLHTSPALLAHPGRQSGIQLALSPLGASRLLGLPAGELANTDVSADAVLGGFAVDAQERLRAAATWAQRFRLLDELLQLQLLRRESRVREAAPEVVRCWTRLLASGGTAGVAELAAEVGWSGRHLASRFQAQIGLTPKAAARVVRFDRARRMLPRAASVAEVAALCGYYDQAHLAREFRALAGCPPSQWLAEEPDWTDAEEERDTTVRSSETSKPTADSPRDTVTAAGIRAGAR